jgi:hypothetical protein
LASFISIAKTPLKFKKTIKTPPSKTETKYHIAHSGLLFGNE